MDKKYDKMRKAGVPIEAIDLQKKLDEYLNKPNNYNINYKTEYQYPTEYLNNKKVELEGKYKKMLQAGVPVDAIELQKQLDNKIYNLDRNTKNLNDLLITI